MGLLGSAFVTYFRIILQWDSALDTGFHLSYVPNVGVEAEARFGADSLERFVGIFILAVHALDLSEIVAARSMLFARGWWRVHFTCGSPYIPIPTSRVRGPDTLWRVPWTRLFKIIYFSLFWCRGKNLVREHPHILF